MEPIEEITTEGAAAASLSFGSLLKRLRTEARLTQEALAVRAGISTRSIRALEHGGGQPQRETAQCLVAALGLEGKERDDFLAAAAPTPRRSGGARHQEPLHFPEAPLPPTSTVGRAAEVDAVAALLRRDDLRLVTLTGPGGVGKTRLALQVAQAVQADFSDGVAFIALAPLADARLVPAAIASGFRLREVGTQPILLTLTAHLRDKRLLLVLDNFEHLLDAAPDIAALAQQAPHLKLLVTSRIPLRLQGEQLYPVPPLALPPHDRPVQLAAAGESDAVRLFVQRATMARPDFVLDEGNAAAVAAITHLLDGLPLAIELAAARTAVLPPHALLQRLSHPLEVLTGGARDLPPRQQTLRDTIAWSYALLEPPEKALFRRLSVCAGGCLPDAAAAIALDGDQPAGEPVSEDDVIDMLLSLVEKNMMYSEEQPTAGEAHAAVRFGMLETIREYGREQLAAVGESERTERRHAAYYLHFAERAAERLQGPDQVEWLQGLDCELANLRAALAWQPQAEAAGNLLEDKLRVAGKLFLYAHLRGRYTEAITWIDQLLARPGAEAPTIGRAWALSAFAALRASTGDNTTVYEAGSEALAIARQLGDPPALANALHILGTLDVALSPPDALLQEDSLCHLVEAMELRHTHHDAAGMALTADYMGFRLLRNGDYAGALPYFEQGFKLGQSLHDHWTTGMALLGMAEALFLLGDVAAAQTLAERSLIHHDALGDQHGSGHILGLLGDLAQAAGDLPTAESCYDKSIRALRTMGEAPRNVRTLWALATLAAANGEADRALTLAGAAVNLSQTALVSPYTVDDPRLAPLWELAGQPPAQTARSKAWQTGADMTLDEALQYATLSTDSGNGLNEF